MNNIQLVGELEDFYKENPKKVQKLLDIVSLQYNIFFCSSIIKNCENLKEKYKNPKQRDILNIIKYQYHNIAIESSKKLEKYNK